MENRWNGFSRQTFELLCDALSMETDCIFELVARYLHWRFAADVENDLPPLDPAADDRTGKGEYGAVRFGVPLQGKHRPMGIDDTRGGRKQGTRRPQLGLHCVAPRRAEPLQIIHAIGFRFS